MVGAGLSAHGHEAPGAGRDREAADAAAPALGTVIDFELTDAGGNRVRAVDLRGRWLLIFFGYTFCPDLCPTTLSEIAGALAQLGPLAARVQPVFVSIDPQRDTSKALREYVEHFDARILPLSGNAEQLARAAASVGVVFYKVPGPTPDEYTFAHNAIVTLVGPEGNHLMVLSSDDIVGVFPSWARSLPQYVDLDLTNIILVTLSQPILVQMMRTGGITLGNLTLDVSRSSGFYPDIFMGYPEPLRQLRRLGAIEQQARFFCKNRGVALLVRKGNPL